MNTTSAQQHPDHRRAGPSLARGLGASLLFGLIGAAIPIIVLAIMMVGRWMIFGANEFDRGLDRGELLNNFPGPSIGTACLFVAAGWATYTPATPQRFSRTLVIIALISIVSWFPIGLIEHSLSPPRFKGSPEPPFSLLPLLTFLSPPALASVWLTRRRNASGRRDETVIQDASAIKPGHPAIPR